MNNGPYPGSSLAPDHIPLRTEPSEPRPPVGDVLWLIAFFAACVIVGGCLAGALKVIGVL